MKIRPNMVGTRFVLFKNEIRISQVIYLNHIHRVRDLSTIRSITEETFCLDWTPDR